MGTTLLFRQKLMYMIHFPSIDGKLPAQLDSLVVFVLAGAFGRPIS
ncbi:hypothetical protein [Brevibacillus brevis]|nr:hypothetical protein [Brevibacillus brevis]